MNLNSKPFWSQTGLRSIWDPRERKTGDGGGLWKTESKVFTVKAGQDEGEILFLPSERKVEAQSRGGAGRPCQRPGVVRLRRRPALNGTGKAAR
ncbi:hypothetical protein SKAU_G00252920 [Synaphobranchus kaupii]|uniref:Uncharacterized protein n=1 Tax=Synaphobranchus kaupii TaxID=118154 RepID=A0A9Q1F3L4_SYNKA|nr:hypothetical protein SKAU_G00252920 [Synaphobranchus kaupii]